MRHRLEATILDFGGQLRVYENFTNLDIISLPGREEGATTIEGWIFGLIMLEYNVIYWRP